MLLAINNGTHDLCTNFWKGYLVGGNQAQTQPFQKQQQEQLLYLLEFFCLAFDGIKPLKSQNALEANLIKPHLLLHS
uniref:Uncharacterized protein n=1 Tax=Arundo donax TaxID=35708 RepID=A0A0A9FTD5_ARUDO